MSETPYEENPQEGDVGLSDITGLVWAAKTLSECVQKRAFQDIGGSTTYEHLADKEVRTSVEASVINICNRLDKLVCDDRLWESGRDKETESRKKAQAHLNSHPMLAYNIQISAAPEGVVVALPGAKAPRASGPNLEAALDNLQRLLFPTTKNPT